MTWILCLVRKQIISCKLTKTLKKSESHMEKETNICTYFVRFFFFVGETFQIADY